MKLLSWFENKQSQFNDYCQVRNFSDSAQKIYKSLRLYPHLDTVDLLLTSPLLDNEDKYSVQRGLQELRAPILVMYDGGLYDRSDGQKHWFRLD